MPKERTDSKRMVRGSAQVLRGVADGTWLFQNGTSSIASIKSMDKKEVGRGKGISGGLRIGTWKT